MHALADGLPLIDTLVDGDRLDPAELNALLLTVTQPLALRLRCALTLPLSRGVPEGERVAILLTDGEGDGHALALAATVLLTHMVDEPLARAELLGARDVDALPLEVPQTDALGGARDGVEGVVRETRAVPETDDETLGDGVDDLVGGAERDALAH